jgi:hypothetical protein
MSRSLLCLSALALAVSPLAAQTSQPGEPIRLTLHPAAAPSPASRYVLLQDRADQVPGNAATLYYRAEALLVDNGTLVRDVKDGPWSVWAGMPLEELPLAEIRDRLDALAPVLHEVDEAARRRECDWQLSNRAEGVELRLPELQGFRSLGMVLAVRARCETARGHIPEAVQALQGGYALGRGLNEGPTLIHVLVGAAIVNIMNAQLETLLQQPGAPNLYWALTVLPRPYFDGEVAIHQEGTFMDRTWPWLKQMEDGPLTAGQLQAVREQMERTRKLFGLSPLTAQEAALHALEDAWTYREARRGLLRDGLTAEQVDALPAFQALALYTARDFRRAWQDWVVWFRVPNGWREPGYRASFEQLARADRRLARVLLPGEPGGGIAPALENVAKAFGRTERRFAALRCLEAVRLYAAAHDGRLPAKLADVTTVPVPSDPVTGKPFEYETDGGKARLSAPLFPGEKPVPGYTLVYELTIRP